MVELALEMEKLRVASFRTDEGTAQPSAALAVTLRECGTHDWTCPFTG